MKKKYKPFVYINEDISSESLKKGLAKATNAGCPSALVLCATDSADDCEGYSVELRASAIQVFGGIFPRLLCDGKQYKKALLILGLPSTVDYLTFKNISDPVSRHQTFEDRDKLATLERHQNFFLFVDGLSTANEAFIDEAYQYLGSGNNYIGGGAGYFNFVQQPCIITNEGLFENAAIIAASPWKLNLSVSHGWDILSGPYLATETQNGRITTINYEPALNVYQKELSNHTSRQDITQDFFAVSSSYPLGVPGLTDEIIVRDPISFDGTDIICAGEILPNSKIYILHGKKETLTEAVRNTLKNEIENTNCALVFNCIGRAVFLGSEMEKELAFIKSELPSCLSFGVFSIGEIITGKSGSINWLNKSVSIARLELS